MPGLSRRSRPEFLDGTGSLAYAPEAVARVTSRTAGGPAYGEGSGT